MRMSNTAHIRQSKGRSQSLCLVPAKAATTCSNPPIGSHSIQRALLSSFAVRGKVMMFPRDIPTILARLVNRHDDPYPVFVDRSRWHPIEIGVREASTRRFACEWHDSEVFRPIERNGVGLPHPLDTPVLTDEQCFLISYRLVMMELDDQIGLGRATPELTDGVWRDQRVPIGKWLHRERIQTIRKTKSLFDDCYLSGQFASLIQTSIDEIIPLPLRLAVSGRYTLYNNVRAGEVYLTLYPIGSAVNYSGAHVHRLVVSHLRTSTASRTITVNRIKSVINLANSSSEGTMNLVFEVLSSIGNAFFSPCDYEQQISDQHRRVLERKVGKDLIASMRPYLSSVL